MIKIKISVIIPTWKRVDILKEVIESLLIQDYPQNNFEVIICDSQSKDGTEELIKYYKQSKPNFNIKLNNSIINAQSIKRNDGAKIAKGEILIFLDDDVIPSKSLVTEYSNAHQGSKNNIFLGLSLFSKERAKNSNLLTYRNERAKKIIGNDKLISPENFVSMNFSIKKKDFLKIGMFDPIFTNYGGEDHDFPIRMKEMGFSSKFCSGAKSEHKEPSPNLYGRMKKVFISANKGFVPLKNKFPSFFVNSTIGLLEEKNPDDSINTKIKKYFINYLLIKFFVKPIARFLCWSDNRSFFYQPILFRIVFAFSYLEGVKARDKNLQSETTFDSWKFWSRYI